jgi:DNA ligase-4
MVVFFDVLLIDNKNLIFESYTKRSKHLSEIINVREGWVRLYSLQSLIQSILPTRFHLPLDPLDTAIANLRSYFAEAITLREEGFVLKPADTPYTGRHGWLKLKKDYIPNHGDTLDFCVVGAGFDAGRARDGVKALQNTKWNIFHIGCLENKQQVVEVVNLG